MTAVAASVQAVARRSPREPLAESPWVQVVKAVLYAASAFLYLRTLATPWGLGSSAAAVVLGFTLAALASWRGLRLPIGLGLAAGLVLLGTFGGAWVLDTTSSLEGMDVPSTIHAADVTYFGLATFGAVFGLRMLVLRFGFATILEAALVVGSVVWTFAGHRNKSINQPRFFSDWALSNGIDPTTVLKAMGVAVVVLAVLMLVRRQSFLKVLFSFIVLAALGAGFYFLFDDVRINPPVLTGLGLTKDDQKGDKGGPGGDKPEGGGKEGGKDGKGGGKGDGKGQKGDGQGQGQKGDGGGGGSPPPPQPVAVVVFHDDYEEDTGLLYFRQQVLSGFDGHHLSADTTGTWDKDVITQYPRGEPVEGEPVQVPEFHRLLPTTMFLFTEHPQPVALSHSSKISPVENPNPRQFVAAYDVESQRLTLPYDRLLGRHSTPPGWSDEARRHYLEIPDDPRYEALADIIVRQADPRFADDDVMKAFLIKRYLEKEGFYTRKEKHEDPVDSTADFLFGSLRGYCVHFAHAAVFLFRSLGIPSRVAVGYAVQTQKRSGGSAMFVMSSDAHAWPELFVDGIGWVTFDVYPEQSDEPPRPPVDRELESMLGEIARKDKTGGKNADPDAPALDIPWAAIGWGLLVAVGSLLGAAYVLKVSRRLAPLVAVGARGQVVLRAAMDRFADLGEHRAYGETREAFAERLGASSPTLAALTRAHLRLALGRPGARDPGELRKLLRQVGVEHRKSTPLHLRLLGALNPIGWWFTR